MIETTAGQLASWTKGKLVGGFLTSKAGGVSIDSRLVAQGDIFVPLKGERDGHAYILDAVERGAAGFMTEHMTADAGAALSKGAFALQVEDALIALQRMAAAYVKTLDCRVIGITGSTGKTTTRALIDAVLRTKLSVVSSVKNFNNEIGVPLTLLSAGLGTEACVVEMAMRGPGQIEELASIASPTVGVVTGIGQTHLELLGSVEAIAQAKAELIQGLPAEGVAVLNADDPWTETLKEMTPARVLSFGLKAGEVRAESVELDENGNASFSIVGEDLVRTPVSLSVPGRHNVYNALAAASVGLTCGLTVEQIAAGLSEVVMPGMRLEVTKTIGGVTVVNDAYNANPDSMKAGLGVLKDMRARARRIAVLGDMLELGKAAEEAHRELGRFVAGGNTDLLVTVGELGALIAEGALTEGFDPGSVRSFASLEDAGEFLRGVTAIDDIVLVKASRGLQLERIIEYIR
ncbi:MAG: UDP-N-acetylmuramoyl-tripeptide--D-alanyl-D-alanine ligase [Candidatus Aquicultorales bacterium]